MVLGLRAENEGGKTGISFSASPLPAKRLFRHDQTVIRETSHADSFRHSAKAIRKRSPLKVCTFKIPKFGPIKPDGGLKSEAHTCVIRDIHSPRRDGSNLPSLRAMCSANTHMRTPICLRTSLLPKHSLVLTIFLFSVISVSFSLYVIKYQVVKSQV